MFCYSRCSAVHLERETPSALIRIEYHILVLYSEWSVFARSRESCKMCQMIAHELSTRLLLCVSGSVLRCSRTAISCHLFASFQIILNCNMICAVQRHSPTMNLRAGSYSIKEDTVHSTPMSGASFKKPEEFRVKNSAVCTCADGTCI